MCLRHGFLGWVGDRSHRTALPITSSQTSVDACRALSGGAQKESHKLLLPAHFCALTKNPRWHSAFSFFSFLPVFFFFWAKKKASSKPFCALVSAVVISS
ncbi:hypothetical protein TW95_gp0586 [Pandoravirus inopinatum]|uniref:Uncharacterized protein n=1 Tax=Pandoravirus inopinatum TaxID=1605721 RepID=A0A0B5J6E3_9VIRU|nr:hypothetical protein TW95_gp0586 [Pandoravirus inopinatum]AJF97320.1 hypothetical protein [Pandoravirus inopinatum]